MYVDFYMGPTRLHNAIKHVLPTRAYLSFFFLQYNNMGKLQEFGTILSGNYVLCGEYTFKAYTAIITAFLLG